MTRWNLTKQAKVSLVEIYQYTVVTWGGKQADTYLDKMYDKFRRIADKTILWRPVGQQFEVNGYFTRHKQHYIYWCQASTGEIIITDILHVSMMQGDRLAKAFSLPEED